MDDCNQYSTEQWGAWMMAAITYRRVRDAGLCHDFAEQAAACAAKLIFPQVPDSTATTIVLRAVAWAMDEI